MAWAFVGTASPAAVASGNLTFTEPTGTEEGDLVVASISYRSSAAFSLPDANWQFVASQLSGGNTVAAGTGSIGSGLMAYYVRGPSAPSLIFTRTAGDVAIGTINAYRGNKLTSTYDTGVAATLGAASATVTATGITTALANELLIAAGCAARGNSATAFTAATSPTTSSGATDTATQPTVGAWIERADASTTTGADAGIAIADAVKSTAGATGTLQYTSSSSAQHSLIVGAFQPELSYPDFRSNTSLSTTGTGGQSGCSPGLPSGWQPGDLFVMVIWNTESASGCIPVDNLSWTKIDNTGSLAGGSGSCTAWYRTAISGLVSSDMDASTGTTSSGDAGAMVIAYLNTSGIEAIGSTVDAGADTTASGRAVTTTADYRLVVNLFILGSAAGGRLFTGVNTGGWVQRYHANPGSGFDLSFIDRVKLRAGAVTAPTESINASSSPSVAFGFALKPGSGALPFTYSPMMHMLMR